MRTDTPTLGCENASSPTKVPARRTSNTAAMAVAGIAETSKPKSDPSHAFSHPRLLHIWGLQLCGRAQRPAGRFDLQDCRCSVRQSRPVDESPIVRERDNSGE